MSAHRRSKLLPCRQTRPLRHPGTGAVWAPSAWNSGEQAEQPDSITCHSEAYPSDTLNPAYDPPVTEISLPSLSLFSDMQWFCP